MSQHILTGFGFGPIQAGLFAKEAFQSGGFSRIVVAEIDRRLVDAVRANNGTYYVNVAAPDGIETITINGVELLDPADPHDRQSLLQALAQSTEIVTCLPSVDFYESGRENSVASLISHGLKKRKTPAAIIYTAENNNRAAETLNKTVAARIGDPPLTNVRFLNTVIGKMSRVVDDPAEIAHVKLKAIAPGLQRAFLVEQFNRILVSRTDLPGFTPGIEVFIEKDDLLPFEEAKLYGHNAVHSLLGFIGALKGCTKMTRLKDDLSLMQAARHAFLNEAGAALVEKYACLNDELFTKSGFAHYAEDLLQRMTNPCLADTTARAARDITRKLAPNDRIFGTIQLALDHNIDPENMAAAALAAAALLLRDHAKYNLPPDLRTQTWQTIDKASLTSLLTHIWKTPPPQHQTLTHSDKTRRVIPSEAEESIQMASRSDSLSPSHVLLERLVQKTLASKPILQNLTTH